MKKWEYQIQQIPDPNNIVGVLNKLGAEGWELIGIAAPLFYFKREKK